MQLSKCCSVGLVLLRSTNEKICSGCLKTYDWQLDPGQTPLLGSNRCTKQKASYYVKKTPKGTQNS